MEQTHKMLPRSLQFLTSLGQGSTIVVSNLLPEVALEPCMEGTKKRIIFTIFKVIPNDSLEVLVTIFDLNIQSYLERNTRVC